MQRRNALKNIGLSLGGITISSTVLSLLQSCQKEATLAWTPNFFTLEEAEIVAKTLEVMLPATPDIPGAMDLNLAQFIDGYIKAISPEKEQAAFKAGIEQYLVTTLEATGKKVAKDLSMEEIDSRLAYYLKANAKQQKAWNLEIAATKKGDSTIPSEDAVNFGVLKSLRSRGIFAFKITEHIGENVLAYDAIPDRQEGCVDLQEATGGKAWSL